MMKRIAILITIILATAFVTSTAWWFHLRSVINSLTLVSIRSDIRSDLDILKKLDANETKSLRDDTEQQLALSTVLLFSVLNTANAEETKECHKTINVLKQYKFGSTNDFTIAAINLLKSRSSPVSQ